MQLPQRKIRNTHLVKLVTQINWINIVLIIVRLKLCNNEKLLGSYRILKIQRLVGR